MAIPKVASGGGKKVDLGVHTSPSNTSGSEQTIDWHRTMKVSPILVGTLGEVRHRLGAIARQFGEGRMPSAIHLVDGPEPVMLDGLRDYVPTKSGVRVYVFDELVPLATRRTEGAVEDAKIVDAIDGWRLFDPLLTLESVGNVVTWDRISWVHRRLLALELHWNSLLMCRYSFSGRVGGLTDVLDESIGSDVCAWTGASRRPSSIDDWARAVRCSVASLEAMSSNTDRFRSYCLSEIEHVLANDPDFSRIRDVLSRSETQRKYDDLDDDVRQGLVRASNRRYVLKRWSREMLAQC
ncbi:MAG: hypothetical protein IPJ34_26990 [Myxococcales bacterium]|nr:hypothetical protein [Myxococcales bacterium]